LTVFYPTNVSPLFYPPPQTLFPQAQVSHALGRVSLADQVSIFGRGFTSPVSNLQAAQMTRGANRARKSWPSFLTPDRGFSLGPRRVRDAKNAEKLLNIYQRRPERFTIPGFQQLQFFQQAPAYQQPVLSQPFSPQVTYPVPASPPAVAHPAPNALRTAVADTRFSTQVPYNTGAAAVERKPFGLTTRFVPTKTTPNTFSTDPADFLKAPANSADNWGASSLRNAARGGGVEATARRVGIETVEERAERGFWKRFFIGTGALGAGGGLLSQFGRKKQ
jgi:hypothetical protein